METLIYLIFGLIVVISCIIIKDYIKVVWEIIKLKSSIKDINNYKPREIISIQQLAKMRGKYEYIMGSDTTIWIYFNLCFNTITTDIIKIIYLKNQEQSPKRIIDIVSNYLKGRPKINSNVSFWNLYNNIDYKTTLNDIPKIKGCNITLKKIKMKVYCFSISDFKRIVKEFDLENTIGNVAIISIVNPKDSGLDFTKHPIETSTNENVLNIEFLDDSEDFTVIDAIRIIEFIEKQYKLGNDFYVHCIAGLSRSQAICRFILDSIPEYTYGRELENPLKTPNQHVLSTLKMVYRTEFEDFTISV